MLVAKCSFTEALSSQNEMPPYPCAVTEDNSNPKGRARRPQELWEAMPVARAVTRSGGSNRFALFQELP
jgi:hypothetical protein